MGTLLSIRFAALLAAFQDDDGGSTMANDERIRQFIDEGQQALKDKGAQGASDFMMDLLKSHRPQYDPRVYAAVTVLTECQMPWPEPLRIFDAIYLQRPLEGADLWDDDVFWGEFYEADE
jgi:hypothetical protein